MKKIANITNWIIGILFFIASLMSIISSSFVPGLFLLIASLTLMPISRRFIFPKINEKMSPMIRGALVSILFIGSFVVSGQSNEAQLLVQKEIKLAEEAALLEQQKEEAALLEQQKEEAALLEQQKIAKAAGFLDVEEYKKAKSVAMPTKVLYDKYLEQQAEIKIADEKRKAEEAEKARLAEVKSKADEIEKARLTDVAKVENARQAMLNDNIARLGLLLRCARINGSANQMGEVWWVGMNADGDNSTGFRFPYYNFISLEANEHEIITKGNSAFLFYYNTSKPNEFAEKFQYVASVEKTVRSYLFSRGHSVGSPRVMDKEFTLNRSSGILKSRDTDGYGFTSEYQCNPQSDSDKSDIFTSLYLNIQNYALQRYKVIQAEWDKEMENQKF
jgi:hypothetical protein